MLLFSLPSNTYAITNAHSIRIVNIVDLSGDCGKTIFTGTGAVSQGVIIRAGITVTGSTDDSGGANNDYFNIVVRDSAGHPVTWGNKLIGVGQTGEIIFFGNLLQTPVQGAHPWTISFYDSNTVSTGIGATIGAPLLGTLTFDVRDYISCDGEGSGNIVYPPDDRANWQYGDLEAVFYRGFDNEGNPAINIYCYDGTNSWIGLQASASTENGAVANGCNVTFYILADGAYQFNIYYDGKLYEIECADFECASPDMRYFDPNE